MGNWVLDPKLLATPVWVVDSSAARTFWPDYRDIPTYDILKRFRSGEQVRGELFDEAIAYAEEYLDAVKQHRVISMPGMKNEYVVRGDAVLRLYKRIRDHEPHAAAMRECLGLEMRMLQHLWQAEHAPHDKVWEEIRADIKQRLPNYPALDKVDGIVVTAWHRMNADSPTALLTYFGTMANFAKNEPGVAGRATRSDLVWNKLYSKPAASMDRSA